MKVLAHALGPIGIGGLSLLNSIYSSIGTVTSCGLNSAVTDVLRRPGSNDPTEVRRQTLLFAIVLAVCSVPISGLWVYAIAGQYAGMLTPESLLLVVALAPMTVIMNYVVGLVVGVGSTNQVLALRMTSPAIALVSIVLACAFGLIATPGQAFFFGIAPALLAAFIFFRQLGMTRLVAWRRLDREIAVRLLKLGAAFTAAGFIQEAGSLIVKSIMASGSKTGLASVGYYTAAITICYVPLRIAQSYFGIYRARILSSFVDDEHATRRELRRSTFVLCSIAALSAIVLAGAASFILRAFFNDSFIVAQPILIGVAATLPLKVATMPYVYRCLITGRYFSGLFTEASGSIGLMAGMALFYDSNYVTSVVWAHVIGAALPVIVALATAYFSARVRRAV